MAGGMTAPNFERTRGGNPLASGTEHVAQLVHVPLSTGKDHVQKRLNHAILQASGERHPRAGISPPLSVAPSRPSNA